MTELTLCGKKPNTSQSTKHIDMRLTTKVVGLSDFLSSSFPEDHP